MKHKMREDEAKNIIKIHFKNTINLRLNLHIQFPLSGFFFSSSFKFYLGSGWKLWKIQGKCEAGATKFAFL